MRLNVKHSSKLSKTNKQKKANKEKKEKGPKLPKDYKDMSEPKATTASYKFTAMKYGVVEHCSLKSVKINDDIIEVDSWTQLLILMLYNLINNYPNTFSNMLAEYEVTNMFLCVDTVYGKYSFSGKEYKAYKIYDTEYYLEIIEDTEIIFEALVALTKCMNIGLDCIEFNVINSDMCTLNTEFNNITEQEVIVGIYDVPDYIVGGNHLISVEILGETIGVHRLDAALVAFCNKVADEYGIFRLSALVSSESTGICVVTEDDLTNEHIVKIKDSDIGVYTDGDDIGILQFILNAMAILNIADTSIKFKYKQLKLGNKKEYEVD